MTAAHLGSAPRRTSLQPSITAALGCRCQSNANYTFGRGALLPYGGLALSKRDSVPLTCEELKSLLLRPDSFKAAFTAQSDPAQGPHGQLPRSEEHTSELQSLRH